MAGVRASSGAANPARRTARRGRASPGADGRRQRMARAFGGSRARMAQRLLNTRLRTRRACRARRTGYPKTAWGKTPSPRKTASRRTGHPAGDGGERIEGHERRQRLDNWFSAKPVLCVNELSWGALRWHGADGWGSPRDGGAWRRDDRVKAAHGRRPRSTNRAARRGRTSRRGRFGWAVPWPDGPGD